MEVRLLNGSKPVRKNTGLFPTARTPINERLQNHQLDLSYNLFLEDLNRNWKVFSWKIAVKQETEAVCNTLFACVTNISVSAIQPLNSV